MAVHAALTFPRCRRWSSPTGKMICRLLAVNLLTAAAVVQAAIPTHPAAASSTTPSTTTKTTTSLPPSATNQTNNSTDDQRSCGFPGSPWHGRVELDDDSSESRLRDQLVTQDGRFRHRSSVKYVCNPGYTLLGKSKNTCHGGRWLYSGPECLRDVALRKPAHMSSEASEMKADFAVDGHKETCALSRKGHDDKPLWMVDIIEANTVNYVHLVFGESMENMDVEVRVGDHYPTTGSVFNHLCKNKSFDTVVPGSHYYAVCDKQPRGRYVSVQIRSAGHHMNLCDVAVFSNSSLAAQDVCPETDGHPDGVRHAFRGKCIEVLEDPLLGFDEANQLCRRMGGRLVDHVDKSMQDFVEWQVGLLVNDTNDFRLWLGASRDNARQYSPNNAATANNQTKNSSSSGDTSAPQWRWLDGKPVQGVLITENFDDTESAAASASAASDCVVLDGTAWRAEPCTGKHHRAVCVYDARSCGTAPLPRDAVNWRDAKVAQTPLAAGATSAVRCAADFYLADGGIRCFAGNASLSQTRPECRRLGCDTTLANGTVTFIDGTNRAMFACDAGFILESAGGAELRCLDGGQWSLALRPVCLEDSQPSRILHDALEDVQDVRHFLQGVSAFAGIPSRILDMAMLAAALLACILAVSVVALCCCVARRRRLNKSHLKVTSSVGASQMTLVPQQTASATSAATGV